MRADFYVKYWVQSIQTTDPTDWTGSDLHFNSLKKCYCIFLGVANSNPALPKNKLNNSIT